MHSKSPQDVWHEVWDEAGSRGLDTWHVVKGMDCVQNANPTLAGGPDEDESDAGSG